MTEQISLFGATGRDTLADARKRLLANLDDGTTCPCCKQFAKRYRRRILGKMAVCLITLRKAGRAMTAEEMNKILRHMKTTSATADMAKLRYWGLIVEAGDKRWRITDDGISFVDGVSTVREWAVIYNGECESMEGSWVTIQDALGKSFDYAELMRGQRE